MNNHILRLESFPQHSEIARNEIHVWTSSLNQPTDFVQRLSDTLSQDEQHRANRFHFDIHKKRYIIGRGLLRTILSTYLNITASEICFDYGQHGKPRLQQPDSENTVYFNISHSCDLAMYAFTTAQEIGIDIEYIRPIPDAAQIAERFFSSNEFSAFQTVPTNQKINAFYNCWTRKEAFIKAIGNGLAQPLDSFEVTLHSDEPAKLLKINGDENEAAEWTLITMKPQNNYVAALAVKGHGFSTSCFSI